MVCFTDVPLARSHEHCEKYGRFGIAFNKRKLMNVGAQPVFYATHASNKDMDRIFIFLEEQLDVPSIDQETFRALHRHFYFIQSYWDVNKEELKAYYYEREWRLGAQNLPTLEELNRPNAKFKCIEEGYPPYQGKRIIRGGNEYFKFEKEDVAFLIAPESKKSEIINPNQIPIIAYESLVKK